MISVRLDRPWLEFDLGEEMRVLSWAINRPGVVLAKRVFWREVRDGDLAPDFDVDSWLAAELVKRQAADAITFLTSRDVGTYTESKVTVEEVTAQAVATVGLTNAERVGQRQDRNAHRLGTINVAVRLNIGMAEQGLLEALSIAVEARTAAVMEAGLRLPTGIATGTGTDCLAVAAPIGAARFAGMHTAAGEAVGRAVHDATRSGIRSWISEKPVRIE